MSIRDFFNKSYKTLSSDVAALGAETESTGNLSNRLVNKKSKKKYLLVFPCILLDFPAE